eukprot:gene23406-30680_t
MFQDQFLWEHPDFLNVQTAGNDGAVAINPLDVPISNKIYANPSLTHPPLTHLWNIENPTTPPATGQLPTGSPPSSFLRACSQCQNGSFSGKVSA